MRRTRFAPSPTGRLHLGHAFSAFHVWRTAQEEELEVMLRIEDIDHNRSRPEYEAAIYEDLRWLDLRWREPVLRQSERRSHYDAQLRHLRERGLVYRCFLSRREVEGITSAPHHPPGMPFEGHPLTRAEEDARLDAGDSYAWRLSMRAVLAELRGAEDLTFTEIANGTENAKPVPTDIYGDVIVGRKDVGVSYHIASVTDDIAQGITDVTRGEDLAPYAGLHRLLYALFGATPPVYRHHPLLLGDDDKRLSKRNSATSLKELRDDGATPEEVRRRLGF